MSSQYVIPPPDIPEFMYRNYLTAWRDLIEWAKKEYRARLRYCARNGYKKQWLILMEEYSAIRILAEMTGYRKFISIMTKGTWRQFDRNEKAFFLGAYELRDFLKR